MSSEELELMEDARAARLLADLPPLSPQVVQRVRARVVATSRPSVADRGLRLVTIAAGAALAAASVLFVTRLALEPVPEAPVAVVSSPVRSASPPHAAAKQPKTTKGTIFMRTSVHQDGSPDQAIESILSTHNYIDLIYQSATPDPRQGFAEAAGAAKYHRSTVVPKLLPLPSSQPFRSGTATIRSARKSSGRKGSFCE